MTKSKKTKFLRPTLLLICFAIFYCLAGCGGSTDTAAGAGTNTTTTTSTAASLNLLVSPPTVQSGSSNTTTITITALNASNVGTPGVPITMSTDYGILTGAANVITDGNGAANVTFSSGGNQMNRTATITATAGTVSAKIPVEIVGSTVTLNLNKTVLPADNSTTAILTVTPTDSGGYPAYDGTIVTLTQSGTGSVNLPTTSLTTTGGTYQTTITGATAGTVNLIARALGASATKTLTISLPSATFAIDKQTLSGTILTGNPNPSAMTTSDTLAIEVNAPSISSVTFTSGQGAWVGGGSSIAVVPAGGKATATLTQIFTGLDTVSVCDTATFKTCSTLQVYVTSSETPYSVTLQATPTVVPMTTGASTLIATVRDAHAPTGYPIANVPVSFSILNPTGGNETISPVVKLTGADGTATTTFTSGTAPSSDAGGVKIRATVVGTTVATGTSPSGNDSAIVIGGQAGSMAFGQSTSLSKNDNSTQYIQAMSVLVVDLNGNPISGATISLSAWPVAWSTGKDCAYDTDNGTNKGTFLNEDQKENSIFESDEDGVRIYYSGTYAGTPASGTGTKDGVLTPGDSRGGSVPSTVKTDASGIADFNLTYPIDSSIWIVTRIRASTIVQGSETVGQTIFHLAPMQDDVSPCKITDPSYNTF